MKEKSERHNYERKRDNTERERERERRAFDKTGVCVCWREEAT